MDIEEIVKEWLKANGYDGLYNSELECGCQLGDLMPCSEPHTSECLAGVGKLIDEDDRIIGTNTAWIIGPKETDKK